MYVLRRIGPDASEAIPKIIEALKEDDGSDAQFRAELRFALGDIGSTNAEAVGELTESLASEVDDVRLSACFALGPIGPAAAAAVPALEKNLDGDHEFLALVSVWALLKIKPGDKDLAPKATLLLAAGLTNENPQVRVECAGQELQHEIARDNSLTKEQLDSWRQYITGTPPAGAAAVPE